MVSSNSVNSNKSAQGLVSKLLSMMHSQCIFHNYVIDDHKASLLHSPHKNELQDEIKRQQRLGEEGMRRKTSDCWQYISESWKLHQEKENIMGYWPFRQHRRHKYCSYNKLPLGIRGKCLEMDVHLLFHMYILFLLILLF